jgi:hypothetical protein
VTAWNTRTGVVTLALADVTAVGGAPLASPNLTGAPTAPTGASGDNSTQIATDAFVQAAVAPAFHDTGRNLLQNALYNIQQRGAGPWAANGNYTADRWSINLVSDTVSVSLVALADADRNAIGDEAANAAWQNVFTGSAVAGAYTNAQQAIESVRRLSGKTVTVSFWAKAASGTPKIGININQNFGTGGTPSASVWALATGASVTIGTSWARYSVTIAIPSASGKTLGTNGTDYSGLVLFFSSGTTANSAAGNIGVQSGTVQLWGLQCEFGSVATPLEKIDPQQDLAKCQRFYQVNQFLLQSNGTAGQSFGMSVALPVSMRAAPLCAFNVSGNFNVGTVSITVYSATTIAINAPATASGWSQIWGQYAASADL